MDIKKAERIEGLLIELRKLKRSKESALNIYEKTTRATLARVEIKIEEGDIMYPFADYLVAFTTKVDKRWLEINNNFRQHTLDFISKIIKEIEMQIFKIETDIEAL